MKNKEIIYYGGRQSGKTAQLEATKQIVFKNGFTIALSSDRPPIGQLKGDNPSKLWDWSEMI